MNPDVMNATVSLVVLANAIVLITVSQDFPDSLRPSARDWQLGTLLIAVGAGLVATGRWLPLPLMITLANGTLAFGLAAYRRAVRRFVGAPPARFEWGVPCAVALAMLWFSTVQVDFMARLVVATVSWVWLMAGAIRLLSGPWAGPGSRAQKMLVAVYSLIVAFLVVRFLLFLPHDLPSEFTVATRNVIVNLVSPVFLVLLPTVGTTAFTLMCTDRVRRQLEMAASTDYLTGLPNRRGLGDTGSRMFDRAQLKKGGFAVVLLDIDGFKAVNDTHGHDTGDQVLVQVASRLREGARAGDVIARVGGEEFVVLLEDVDPQGSVRAAERIREEIAREPVSVGPAALDVTVSAGVAYVGAEERSFEDTLRRADHALYLAKSNGRNRVEASR